MKNGLSGIVAVAMLLATGIAASPARSAGEVATVTYKVAAHKVALNSPDYRLLVAFIARHGAQPGVRMTDPQDLGDFTVGYTRTSSLSIAQAERSRAIPSPPYAESASAQYGAGDSFHAETCLDGHIQRWEFTFGTPTGWLLHDYTFRLVPGGSCPPPNAGT